MYGMLNICTSEPILRFDTRIEMRSFLNVSGLRQRYVSIDVETKYSWVNERSSKDIF